MRITFEDISTQILRGRRREGKGKKNDQINRQRTTRIERRYKQTIRCMYDNEYLRA